MLHGFDQWNRRCPPVSYPHFIVSSGRNQGRNTLSKTKTCRQYYCLVYLVHSTFPLCAAVLWPVCTERARTAPQHCMLLKCYSVLSLITTNHALPFWLHETWKTNGLRRNTLCSELVLVWVTASQDLAAKWFFCLKPCIDMYTIILRPSRVHRFPHILKLWPCFVDIFIQYIYHWSKHVQLFH